MSRPRTSRSPGACCCGPLRSQVLGAILPHLLGFPLVTLANEATNWWEVALPAISGLVGVVVGGLITRWVTLSAEDRRADLERELATAAAMRDEQRAIAERTTLAQAVARVLATRYRQIESHIGTSLNAGVWPPRELEPEPPVPYEDRKLLASIMSSSARCLRCVTTSSAALVSLFHRSRDNTTSMR